MTPKPSAEPLRFEEMSAGLPRAGMWRENFDLGDVLGLGHPQIVAPPAAPHGSDAQGLPSRKGRRRQAALAGDPAPARQPREDRRGVRRRRRRGHGRGRKARHRLRGSRLRAGDRVQQGRKQVPRGVARPPARDVHARDRGRGPERRREEGSPRVSDDPEWIRTRRPARARAERRTCAASTCARSSPTDRRTATRTRVSTAPASATRSPSSFPKDAASGLPFYSSALPLPRRHVQPLRVRPEGRGVPLPRRRRHRGLRPGDGRGRGHLQGTSRRLRARGSSGRPRAARRRSTARA